MRGPTDAADLAGLIDTVAPAQQMNPPVTDPCTPPATTPDTSVSTTFTTPGVDWAVVVKLRREASRRITSARNDHRQRTGLELSEEDSRMLGGAIIRSVVHSYADRLAVDGKALWTTTEELAHVNALTDAIFGYGRLQPLFDIAEAENIEISGCEPVHVQYGDGHREEHPPVADSDEELV